MSMSHDATYYRHRADQLREAAAAALSDDDRDTLMSFADQFDTFAEDTEPPDRYLAADE